MPVYKVDKVVGPKNHWPDQGPSNGAVILYDVGFFCIAVRLSQVIKILRQLTGQISAHYSSSKILNTHLRIFRPN